MGQAMLQLSLPIDTDFPEIRAKSLMNHTFSHNGTCDESVRCALEDTYSSLFEETSKFNRRIVSFQANKIETLHNWFKYREGFSAQLVEILLNEFSISETQQILDPFAGSCTTLLEAKLNGLNAVGIELLPHCHLAWKVKANIFAYQVDELCAIRDLLRQDEPPATNLPFPHLTITEGAFPAETERAIVDYKQWFETLDISGVAKTLCQAVLMSILEDVSYTRKDGQYLRWDSRAEKIVTRNKTRVESGQEPVEGIDKGILPSVKIALLRKFDSIIRDVHELQQQSPPASQQQLIKGSSLYVLPQMEPNQFDAVITSPPYANRYDYTRTYALELAYLNVDNHIFDLRQGLLSCTVENRPKSADLQVHYQTLGRIADYKRITEIIGNNAALNEINRALSIRNSRGEINNRGVLKMIEQYFAELTFIYSELYRVCRSGAYVAFVNDNVRYAGEVIPVDLISTNLAEAVGFTPIKVYVLPQRKGNSSQQMGKFGRQELRKSITIWKKP
ncbi:MAG: modification methylase [Caldilinea sp. CFX5]|nr:modification methylase [Caldilinea sp. CFX5]